MLKYENKDKQQIIIFLAWNNLKTILPSAATISSRVSKWVPSVVSLYGAHRENVKKSNMADITSAPVLCTTWTLNVSNKVSRNFFEERSEYLFSCSCRRSYSSCMGCMNNKKKTMIIRRGPSAFMVTGVLHNK